MPPFPAIGPEPSRSSYRAGRRSQRGRSATGRTWQRGGRHRAVVDGNNHDICYIPGGSLVHPYYITLYRMELDRTRYDAFPKAQTLRRMSETLLERSGLTLADVVAVLCSNISSEDETTLQEAFAGKVSPVCAVNRETHGHLQGTDFPLNYLSLRESGAVSQGDYVLSVSHGMGATAAVNLIRY